jgi:hypothetical protein
MGVSLNICARIGLRSFGSPFIDAVVKNTTFCGLFRMLATVILSVRLPARFLVDAADAFAVLRFVVFLTDDVPPLPCFLRAAATSSRTCWAVAPLAILPTMPSCASSGARTTIASLECPNART